MKNTRDTVYAEPLAEITDFRFDARVADVFPDMIQRSVPGYGLLLEMIGMLTATFARPETNCYDLGCSLGASTLEIRRNLPDSCRVIGVDNSAAMVERCRQNIGRDRSKASVEIRQEDILDTRITNASVVVMNFTLQFVEDGKRQDILSRIAGGLNAGGILILSEKIRYENAQRQALLTDLHHAFKKHQGYSDLEIAQKRASLDNVLVPNTAGQHLERLRKAGFTRIEPCVTCLNFISFLAIR